METKKDKNKLDEERRIKHNEYIVEYRKKNKEKVQMCEKNSRDRNKEGVSKKNIKYYQKNRDIMIEKKKERYKKNPEKNWEEKIIRKYGINKETYMDMFNKQGGKCCICYIPQDKLKRRLAVDHCHKTGKVRALLCLNCNRGIGMLKDNPEYLRRAVELLEVDRP